MKLKYLLKCCNVSLDEVYLKRHNSFNQKSPLRLGTQTDRQSDRKIGRQTDGRTGGYRENSSTIDAVVMLLSCRRGARTVQLASLPHHLEISYYVNFLGHLGSNGFQLKQRFGTHGNYSFEVKNIEIWAPAFSKHKNSFIATL